jgi:integrase
MSCEQFFIAQKSAELLGLVSGIRGRVFEHKREQYEQTGQEPPSLLSWAEANGTVTRNVAFKARSVRVTRERRPLGLPAAEVHGLLRATGETCHGRARRNYALVQLILQTGLRFGEVAALRPRDIVLRERAGTVPVRNVKGLKERKVPLNAIARRALRQLLEQEPSVRSEAAVFRSGRSTAMPVRSIQNVVAALVRQAGMTKSDISAHHLRHTFALAWLRQHPGRLVDLSQLLGHKCLDTTAVYNEFGVVFFLGAKGVITLPLLVYDKAIQEFDYITAGVCAVINVALSLALFILYRLLLRGLAGSLASVV